LDKGLSEFASEGAGLEGGEEGVEFGELARTPRSGAPDFFGDFSELDLQFQRGNAKFQTSKIANIEVLGS